MKSGLYENTAYTSCGYVAKNDIHALFDCNYSREAWHNLPWAKSGFRFPL